MKERKVRLGTHFPGCVVSKFRKIGESPLRYNSFLEEENLGVMNSMGSGGQRSGKEGCSGCSLPIQYDIISM